MKKGVVIFAAIVLTIVLLAGSLIGSYNSLVTLNEELNNKLAAIDTNLQRRNDLIPNLVNTVKGYTAHESGIISEVSDARARLLSASTAEEVAGADEALTSAVGRLLAIAESYPELKADTQFTALTDELSGTENRISVARKDYNDAAASYNKKIKSFPTVLIAGMFGFEKAEYFKASERAQRIPEVDFS